MGEAWNRYRSRTLVDVPTTDGKGDGMASWARAIGRPSLARELCAGGDLAYDAPGLVRLMRSPIRALEP